MLMKLKREIEFAKEGLKLWKEIVDKNAIKTNNKVILIFQNLNCSSDYIEGFFKVNNFIDNPLFFLISEDKARKDLQRFLTNHYDRKLIFLKKNECMSIMNLYNLYMFTNQLFILSPNMPIGRTGYNLVRNGFLTEEEYVKIALLNNI